MSFEPIAGTPYGTASDSWTQPLVLPDGFSQELVIDATTFDIHPGQDDLSDMNTVNETGPQAGRYLYRTTEVNSNGAVANTSEDRVVAIDLDKKVLSSYVWAGVNVPVENAGAGVTGFNNPDNLAQGPDGRLWIVEDNFMSDIWVAGEDADHDGTADSVEQFASLVDSDAEISGIYFGKDPKTLFLNVQHPEKPLADGTWKVTKG